MVKATKLRQNLYQLLDAILETGKPLEVERNGKTLRIIPVDAPSKLDLLEEHHALNGRPEDILGLDWSQDWNQADHFQPEQAIPSRRGSKTKKSLTTRAKKKGARKT